MGQLPRVKSSTKGEGTERRYFYGAVWAVCAAEPVLGLLWKILPRSHAVDVEKLAVFVAILAGMGLLRDAREAAAHPRDRCRRMGGFRLMIWLAAIAIVLLAGVLYQHIGMLIDAYRVPAPGRRLEGGQGPPACRSDGRGFARRHFRSRHCGDLVELAIGSTGDRKAHAHSQLRSSRPRLERHGPEIEREIARRLGGGGGASRAARIGWRQSGRGF